MLGETVRTNRPTIRPACTLNADSPRTTTQYKSLLANADAPRQGDYDGSGQLTEKGLISFCDYMLDTAIDQVTYIGLHC